MKRTLNVKASNRNAVFAAIEKFLCRRKNSITQIGRRHEVCRPGEAEPSTKEGQKHPGNLQCSLFSALLLEEPTLDACLCCC